MKNNESIQQIYGEYMTPCFMTEEEYENGYRKSMFWTESNFYSEYRKHIVAMEHVSNCAKIFILKNYEQVKDWSKLNVIVIHGQTGKPTEYYNYVPDNGFAKCSESKRVQKYKIEQNERNKKKHNPITSITDVVLDPTDGDFSLTINGKEHWWIQNEAIIIIANYIENQIKSLKNLPSQI